MPSTAAPGSHLSTVLNVKRQAAPVPRVWVGCDSSEVLLSDTGWEHSRWAAGLRRAG